MKVKRTLIVVLFFAIFAVGCSEEDISSMASKAAKAYSEKSMKTEGVCGIFLVCDHAAIEVYTWKKDEVKFEMTRMVRGKETKEALEDKLKKYSVSIRQEESKIFLETANKAIFKHSEEWQLGLKIYIPQTTARIDCTQDSGSLKLNDDLRCTLNISANDVNVDINRLEGCAHINSNSGNIRVGGGKLKGESCIRGKAGNIFVKAALEPSGEYAFETEAGNINLVLLGEVPIHWETSGTIEQNDFISQPQGVSVCAKSALGKIKLRKQ